MILQHEKCYLDTLKIVVSHNTKEDIALNYGVFLKQLTKNLQGQLINTNAPMEAAPETARVVINSKDLNVLFANNRVEFNIQGSRKHTGKDLIYQPYQSKISACVDILSSYFNLDNFKQDFIGILGPVRFPQDIKISKDELNLAVATKYGANFKNKNIVTFNTRLGFLSETAKEFVNYEISIYEVKNIHILPNQHNVIELEKFPTVEHGIQYVLDVNNRPSAKEGDLRNSISTVTERFFESVSLMKKYL